jgi:transposase-like protein
MAKSRSRYSKDFKAQAVGMVAPGGESLTLTAKALGISPGMLSKWIKAARDAERPKGNLQVTSDVAGLTERVGRVEESLRILRRILEVNLRENSLKRMV